MPPGILIFEDPPVHTIHRSLLSPGVHAAARSPRSSRRSASSAPAASTRSSAPGGFDFVADLGAQMPMRVIGMLLGIPEAGPGGGPRRRSTPNLRHRGGRADGGRVEEVSLGGDDVRRLHRLAGRAPVRRPHDRAAARRVRGRDRDAPHAHPRRRSSPTSTVVAGAGNETTTRLIGWAGKVLAEHPDQRRELVEDRVAHPERDRGAAALRAAGPARRPLRRRRTSSSTAQTVPAGSAMLFLVGSANRDERRFPDPDRFDIHREHRPAPHLRLRHPLLPRRRAGPPRGPRRPRRGAATASPSGTSTWTHAQLAPTSTVRGWETLPVVIP